MPYLVFLRAHFKTLKYALIIVLVTCSTSIALELSAKLYEIIQDKYGAKAVKRLQQWEKISNLTLKIDVDKKLQLVNKFFNQAKFIDDLEHWGKEDYWASPVELLARNAGDCEDYSIAKYFTLREMGISDEKMKITYVKANIQNKTQAHMVLSYYPRPDAEPYILDNLIDDIRLASKRPDLVPVYSFNGEGLWLSKLRGQQGTRVGEATKLESWKDLLTRYSKLVN